MRALLLSAATEQLPLPRLELIGELLATRPALSSAAIPQLRRYLQGVESMG